MHHVHDRGQGPADLGGRTIRGQDAPGLPATIRVKFKLRKAGNGGGRVTASGIDCGTVCTTSYGFGKPITLTANPDDGSLFDGWNGVCARTELTCRVPGRADHVDPGGVRPRCDRADNAGRIGDREPDAVEHLDLLARVFGQRQGHGLPRLPQRCARRRDADDGVHVERLKCGRSYAVAVDAVDGLGNRSQRSSVTTQTRPCVLAARLAGVGVGRAGGSRVVIVTVRINRATTARLRLLRGGRTAVTGRFRVAPGANKLRLRVPRRVARGPYRLATTLVNPDGGTLALPARGVLLPRP